jgi:hypothetical protein
MSCFDSTVHRKLRSSYTSRAKRPRPATPRPAFRSDRKSCHFNTRATFLIGRVHNVPGLVGGKRLLLFVEWHWLKS